MTIRGGGGRRLMEKPILNFHPDYLIIRLTLPDAIALHKKENSTKSQAIYLWLQMVWTPLFIKTRNIF